MFLDQTFFQKYPTKLSQAESLGTGVNPKIAAADLAFIQEVIDEHEAEFYVLLLGQDLADELFLAYQASLPTGTEETPVPGTPLPTKWQTLVDKLVNTTLKKSPSANYVYFHALIRKQSETLRSGEKAGKSDEMTQVSCAESQTIAWNLGVDKLRPVVEWLIENKADYEHDDVYLEIEPSLVEYENRYDI
jgi:hypothetical protein